MTHGTVQQNPPPPEPLPMGGPLLWLAVELTRRWKRPAEPAGR